MWKNILRFLARIGIKAGAETVVERVESGPITTGNVLKPAGKAAAKAALDAVLSKKKSDE